jgi:hypothetical protein
VGLDQGQGELSDLASQLLEAVVFLSPLCDLGNQFEGDVSGVGFGFDLPGEVMTQVLFTLCAAAVGIAASAADGDQACGQDWTFSLELLLAGLEEALDEGGVLGYFHGFGGVPIVFEYD